MKNLEMTKEEIKQSISEQTNDMSIQEIFTELKEMNIVASKIGSFGSINVL